MVTKDYYLALKKELAEKSVEALIAEFNESVGRQVWTSIDDLHDSILIDTLIKKGVDVSAIYDGIDISYERQVALNGDKNRIVII